MNAESYSLNGLKCLIVDDEAENLQVSQSILEFFGATVRIAQSGAEALEIAGAWEPMIILLDIALPSMDGWAILRALRKMPALVSTPVIAFTAQVDDADKVFAKGFDGHLRKPFDIADLMDAITDCLRDQITRLPSDDASAAAAT